MLPDVNTRMPTDISADHARRIRAFLHHCDDKLDREVRVVVYGSAALSVYFADREEIAGYTDDIDIGKVDPETVDIAVDSDAVEPPLRLQTYAIERWLVHPDWEEDVVDVSSLLGLARLTVRLLHPIDLLISKLERNSTKDHEDGRRIRTRYVDDVETVKSRLNTAWKFYPSSEHAAREIEHAFQAIFEQEYSLVEE